MRSRRVCPGSSRPPYGPSLAEPSICKPVERPSVGFADDKVHWRREKDKVSSEVQFEVF